jgi:hypothetical protein
LLRDVLMRRTPRVFERGEPYTIAALLAVLVFLAGDQLGLDRSISTAAGAVSGQVLKFLDARLHWETPAVRFRVDTPYRPSCAARNARNAHRIAIQLTAVGTINLLAHLYN